MLINERVDDNKIIEELSGTSNRMAIYKIGEKVDCAICSGALITRVIPNMSGVVYEIKYTDNNGKIQTDLVYESDVLGKM